MEKILKTIGDLIVKLINICSDRNYTVLTQLTDKPGSVEAGHNTITFFNKGTETVLINGFPLAQNESLVIGGNRGEIDQTKWLYSFGNSGGSRQLFILRKIYGK
jgi:hypothetical protein